MPITKETDREKNLTVLKVKGIVPFDSFREAITDFYDSGATDSVIFDLREAEGEGKTFSHDRIYRLAGFLDSCRKDREMGKTALVTNKDILFGICRTLEAYKSNSSIKYSTFRTIDEALRWIEDCKE